MIDLGRENYQHITLHCGHSTLWCKMCATYPPARPRPFTDVSQGGGIQSSFSREICNAPLSISVRHDTHSAKFVVLGHETFMIHH